MAAALVLVCVDPRLNHELIRLQVRQRLGRSGLHADRIYLLNEIGGNPSPNLRHTIELLVKVGDPIVCSAVLHHDDCVAARTGLRTELAKAAQEVAAELNRQHISCPVLTGEIRTEHNHLLWSDEPEVRYLPFTFGSNADG
jgi:hypothetical protein